MFKKEGPKDYYKVLGVDRSASQRAIRKAYHKLSLKNHSDKTSVPTQDMRDINIAYNILKCEESRKQYDLELSYNISFAGEEGSGIFSNLWRNGFSPFFSDTSGTDAHCASWNSALIEFCRERGYPEESYKVGLDEPNMTIHNLILRREREAVGLVEFLIAKKKQDVNELNSLGQSCLYMALQQNMREYARVLMRYGADLNRLPYVFFYTMLDYMLEGRYVGSWDLAKTMIKAGAYSVSCKEYFVKELKEVLVDDQGWAQATFDDFCNKFDKKKTGRIWVSAWHSVLLFAKLEQIPQIVDLDDDQVRKAAANYKGCGRWRQGEYGSKHYGLFPAESVDKNEQLASEETRILLDFRIKNEALNPIVDKKSYEARWNLAQLLGRFDIMGETLSVDSFKKILDKTGLTPEQSANLLTRFVTPGAGEVTLTPLDIALLFGTPETVFEMVSKEKEESIFSRAGIDMNSNRAGTWVLYTDCFVERMHEVIASIKNDDEAVVAGLKIGLMLDAHRFEQIYVQKTTLFPTNLESIDKSMLSYAVVRLYLDKLQEESNQLVLAMSNHWSAGQKKAITVCIDTLYDLSKSFFKVKSVGGAQYENYIQQVSDTVTACLKSVRNNRLIAEKFENYLSLLMQAFKHWFLFMFREVDANKAYTAGVASPCFFKPVETSKDSFANSLKKFPDLARLLSPVSLFSELGEERLAEEVKEVRKASIG